MKKYQNKYRIPSARLQNWDYGANGAYFITICTDKMKCYFGDIAVQTRFIASPDDDYDDSVQTRLIASLPDAEMKLNEIGTIAHNTWEQIPIQFPYAELGNFVIMPNHMHGILIINKMKMADAVETRLIASLPEKMENGGFARDKNPMLNENISRIIRWYKGKCTFEMRKIHADFSWQSRFYDSIIHDSKSFENVQNYIDNNPSNWKQDKFYN